MTLANKVTLSRLALAFVYFGLLGLAPRGAWEGGAGRIWLIAGFVLFLVTVLLDLADGWLARRYGESTPLGRVLDPMVDKVIVVGSFVIFAATPPLSADIPWWIPIAILTRELAVHVIRSEVERQGLAFGATAWGKSKTFLQNLAAGWALGYAALIHSPAGGNELLRGAMIGLVYVAVAATLLTGVITIREGIRSLSTGAGVSIR